MIILALDTSCDETSAAVTSGGRVLSNIIASQIELHKSYGGVVPDIAKRAHQQLLEPVIDEALSQADVALGEIEAIAVTIGPGLAIALEVGVAKAKELARNYQKPLIAVDHMEGHLLSAFARNANGKFGIAKPPGFPSIGLLVSGGHTELVLMKDFGKYQLIGQTLDDAAGECFDKVARILGLGYPGGPIISKLAQKGNPDALDLPVPMKDSGDFNFSFSGLKTACLYSLRRTRLLSEGETPYKKQRANETSTKRTLTVAGRSISQKWKADFAASFERVAVAHLVDKLVLACREFKPKMVLLGGGVIANQRLQEAIKREMKRLGIPVHLPYEPKLLTDNAAMIGVAAFYKAKRGEFIEDIDRLERVPDLSLG